MNAPEEKDPVWELLKKSPLVKASPFFSRNVVREVRKREAERAEKDPKVFTKIHVHFKVSGPGLTDKAVSRAVKLSAEKFCSASLMLGKAADITHDYEVIDAAGAGEENP